jgi:hypothetical protein
MRIAANKTAKHIVSFDPYTIEIEIRGKILRTPDKPFNIHKTPVFLHTANALATLIEAKQQDTR